MEFTPRRQLQRTKNSTNIIRPPSGSAKKNEPNVSATQKDLHPPRPNTKYLTREELQEMFSNKNLAEPLKAVFIDLLANLALPASTCEILDHNGIIEKIIDAIKKDRLSFNANLSGDPITLIKLFNDFAIADPKAAMRLVNLSKDPDEFTNHLIESTAYHHVQLQILEYGLDVDATNEARAQYLATFKRTIIEGESPTYLHALIANCPPSAAQEVRKLLKKHPDQTRTACKKLPILSDAINKIKSAEFSQNPPENIYDAYHFTPDATRAAQMLLEGSIAFAELTLPEEEVCRHLSDIAAKMLLTEPDSPSIQPALLAMIKFTEDNGKSALFAQFMVATYYSAHRQNNRKSFVDATIDIVDALRALMKNIKETNNIDDIENKSWKFFYRAARHALLDVVGADQHRSPRRIHFILKNAIQTLQ